MKRSKLIILLNGVTDKTSLVKFRISPKSGLKFSIESFITDISYASDYGILYISNLYSDTLPKFTVDKLLYNLLTIEKHEKELSVSFEIRESDIKGSNAIVHALAHDVEIKQEGGITYIDIKIQKSLMG